MLPYKPEFRRELGPGWLSGVNIQLELLRENVLAALLPMHEVLGGGRICQRRRCPLCQGVAICRAFLAAAAATVSPAEHSGQLGLREITTGPTGASLAGYEFEAGGNEVVVPLSHHNTAHSFDSP